MESIGNSVAASRRGLRPRPAAVVLRISRGHHADGLAIGLPGISLRARPADADSDAGGPTTFCNAAAPLRRSARRNQWYDGVTLLPGIRTIPTSHHLRQYNVVVTVFARAPIRHRLPYRQSIPATPTLPRAAAQRRFWHRRQRPLLRESLRHQCLPNGQPIGGETNQTYVATASGHYTVHCGKRCTRAPSAATSFPSIRFRRRRLSPPSVRPTSARRAGHVDVEQRVCTMSPQR